MVQDRSSYGSAENVRSDCKGTCLGVLAPALKRDLRLFARAPPGCLYTFQIANHRHTDTHTHRSFALRLRETAMSCETGSAAVICTQNEARMKAIQRVTAYHRRDFDLAVISFSDRDLEAAKSKLLSTCGPSTSIASTLESLPAELISFICLDLDVASLFLFRQVNRRARQVVNSLREYQRLVTHAATSLSAVLRTRSASGIALCDLYRLF